MVLMLLLIMVLSVVSNYIQKEQQYTILKILDSEFNKF